MAYDLQLCDIVFATLSAASLVVFGILAFSQDCAALCHNSWLCCRPYNTPCNTPYGCVAANVSRVIQSLEHNKTAAGPSLRQFDVIGLTRFNKVAIPNNKFLMASGQGSHWLIESPTIFSSMCSPPLSHICQFYF